MRPGDYWLVPKSSRSSAVVSACPPRGSYKADLLRLPLSRGHRSSRNNSMPPVARGIVANLVDSVRFRRAAGIRAPPLPPLSQGWFAEASEKRRCNPSCRKPRARRTIHGDAPNGYPARRQFARIRRNESQTPSLPNFNDQSSERTSTSLLARLPGVQQIAPSVHKTEGAILIDLAIGPLRVRLPHSPREDQWKPAHS
jgi:hypothetical protein